MDDKLEKIRELIPCQTYDHYLAAKCCFHDDKNPSLMVYPDRYYCKSCGASGTTSRLLRFLETGNFHSSEFEIYHPQLWKKLGDFDPEDVVFEAHDFLKKHWDITYYLKDRRIDTEFVHLMIGYLDGYYIFPIFGGNHEVLGLVARAGPVLQEQTGTRYMIPPNQDLNLLYCPDWDKVQSESYVLVPFGVIDAVSLGILDYPVVSGTVGHNLTAETFQHLRKKIIFLPDGDHWDDAPARKLASALDWRGRVAFLHYPEGTKDCNEVLIKHGPGALIKMIESAVSEVHHRFIANMEKIDGSRLAIRLQTN